MGRRAWTAALAAALLALSATAASAQWSIGAPGSRAAPRGENRFTYLVFANPLPGHEAEFNDWYLNQHLGDLLQLDGWMGAQRFRLNGAIAPRPTPGGYAHGYVVLWDLEGADATRIKEPVGPALNNGKARKGAAFDYSPSGGVSATYRVLGPRITRPDGRKAFMPSMADVKTPRPNRFMMLELTDPAAGIAPAVLEKAVDQRIAAVLGLPGWMAAQRFKLEPITTGKGNAPGFGAYMTVWEYEGPTPQSALDTLIAAHLPALPADPATARTTFWDPISPYVTKDDFER
jgi:hypothetical protein